MKNAVKIPSKYHQNTIKSTGGGPDIGDEAAMADNLKICNHQINMMIESPSL